MVGGAEGLHEGGLRDEGSPKLFTISSESGYVRSGYGQARLARNGSG